MYKIVVDPSFGDKENDYFSFWIYSYERFLDELMPECAILNVGALFLGRI